MQFGSVQNISRAPLHEIQQTKGISINLSNNIYNFFQSVKN